MPARTEASDVTTVPLPIGGGMWSAGDPSSIPDGALRLVQNYTHRPGPRFDVRPPNTYDNLMSVASLLRWEDLTNQQTRMLALDASSNLFQKAASGETWGGAVTGASGTRVTDFANLRGKVYAMLDDGAGSPATAFVYDGSAVSATPFESTLVARTVTAFVDRLIFAYPRVVVTNLAQAIADAYDWLTGTLGWAFQNVTSLSTTKASGVIVGSLTTTSTAATCWVQFSQLVTAGFEDQYSGMVTVAASSSPRPYVWRCDLQNTHASFHVPFTLEWRVMNNRRKNTAYAVGDLVAEGPAIEAGGTLQRCIVAGTSANVDNPALSSTLGAQTVDGGVTWQCEGPNIIASLTGVLPTSSESSSFTTLYLEGAVPPRTNTVRISPALKFYNDASPLCTTKVIVNMSFRDGLADSNPAKANFGQQWTAGSYRYPFFNKESSLSGTRNLETIVWSETSQPTRIRAANFFEPKEFAGLPTAAAVASGRYVMWKRRGMWTFVGQADPDNPLLQEGPARGELGCVGPLARDVVDDVLFWIGENEIFAMRIGGEAVQLCGPGMREEIMAKGSGWVESQPSHNMPLLVVNRSTRELWVYTQKSILYCLKLPDTGDILQATGLWSKHPTPGAAEVRAMHYHRTTGEVYVAYGGFGLARLDPSQAATETIDNTATTYSMTSSLVWRTIENPSPQSEIFLDEATVWHLATASQSGQTLGFYVSRDRGSTYPVNNIVTPSLTDPRVPVPLCQLGNSLTLKVDYVGKGGPTQWSISKAAISLQDLGGDLPYTRPTGVSSSL